MGFLKDLFKVLTGGETFAEKEKKRDEKIFNEEADAYGLTKEERESAKKSGITPQEWAEEHDEICDED